MSKVKKKTKSKVAEFNREEEGKTISISNLPACDVSKMLTSIVHDPVRSKICVVAFRYPGTSKWDAMVGWPDIRDVKIDYDKPESLDVEWLCENVNDAASVKMLGVKLPKEIAVKLFPDWSVLSYQSE